MSDFPFPDISLGLAAELDIGPTDDDSATERDWRMWYTPRILQPKFVVQAVNGTAQSRVGEGPNTNRRWEIRRFIMAAANPIGAAAISGMTVYLFRDVGGGRGLVTPSTFEAMELLWFWTAVPIAQLWGRDEVSISEGEDLIVVITATSAVQVSGNVQVIDKPIIDVTPFIPATT